MLPTQGATKLYEHMAGPIDRLDTEYQSYIELCPHMAGLRTITENSFYWLIMSSYCKSLCSLQSHSKSVAAKFAHVEERQSPQVDVSLASTELPEDLDDWLNNDEEEGLQETTRNMQSPKPIQRDSDREEDFFNVLNRVEPESGRKASEARATKKASEGSSAPNGSSPIVSSHVTRSLSQKPTPATQV
ncbi:hypothetical protein R1sor_008953 [Riccia sorocarpa]|uniref:Uncharacterized protein n=1 Tax=Riccia sorocarpa TaxID=122646 RepID=A0ABD3H8B9_9MARC